jgi:hypothetical protein
MAAPYSIEQPAVMVLHGFNSDCGSVEALRNNLRIELDVPDAFVQCFKDGGNDG